MVPAVETQTEQVILVAMDALTGYEDERTETVGRDLIRLIRQYCTQHPEAFGRLAGRNPLPEYAFNHAPYCVDHPKSDWEEPTLPLGVDWESTNHGVREYEKKVMVFHLVNAAHSLIRVVDPTLHSNKRGDPDKRIKLRDISIGMRDRRHRIVVECSQPPGFIYPTQAYHPHWDVDSEDEVEAYPGESRVEKERALMVELIDRAARRRDKTREIAARLASLSVRDDVYMTKAERQIKGAKMSPEELKPFL